MATVQFRQGDNPFFSALRSRVYAHFEKNGISDKGNWRIHVKGGLLLMMLAGVYTWLVWFTPATWLAVVLCILLGVLFAAIGFNVMHDGAHESFSESRWLNRVMGYSLNLLGGDVQIWKIKHNMIHHSFTNVEGLDDDLDIQPFMRTNSNQRKFSFHRYQHVYFGLFYGLTYLNWVFLDDYRRYFTGRVGATKFRKFSTAQHIGFWATKVLFLVLFLGIPAWKVGFAPALAGFFIVAVSCGILIALVFQLAHVVEHTSFSNAYHEKKGVEDEWAVHQLRTTANFAMGSRVVSWFTGGLNYQVEHHLFPRISHVHYPAISRLVMETCREFNVPYNSHPTMFAAIRSHVAHLRNMGRD